MTMIKLTKLSLMTAFLLGALSAPARAADKTYQVTGPVLEVSDTSITVEKGKEKWQLARTKDTKITGDLKVGSKVTIAYTMTAVSVEVKGDAKAAKGAKGTTTEDPAKPLVPAAPTAPAAPAAPVAPKK
jgi:hypothetical protein